MSWKISVGNSQIERQDMTVRARNVVQAVTLGVQSTIALLNILGVLSMTGVQMSGIVLASSGIAAAVISIGTFGKVDPAELQE